jgi:2-polyprenyl-6-methoxyphenol hydroxylase-like FAD-dependent oxidoreductase
MSRLSWYRVCGRAIWTNGDLQYGKELKDITYEESGAAVTANFKDGTFADGSLLIGADGAQSAVRIHLFGPDKGSASTVPYSALNLHVNYHDVEKAKFARQCHPIMSHGVHPKGYWLWISSALFSGGSYGASVD